MWLLLRAPVPNFVFPSAFSECAFHTPDPHAYVPFLAKREATCPPQIMGLISLKRIWLFQVFVLQSCFICCEQILPRSCFQMQGCGSYHSKLVYDSRQGCHQSLSCHHFSRHFLFSAGAPYSNRMQFDSTRGYPGEGPADTWSLFSHNTGSLRTTMQWQSSQDSVLCVQEPRIGRNNHRDALFRVQAAGRHLFPSKLLPGLITNHGVSRTPHGGAAVLAPRETSIAFAPEQDITGRYLELYNTTRVTAMWHQVTRHVRALIWSFYGRTGASSEQDPHSWNDSTLEAIFEISAQFGDIPIIIAGDFQAEPLSYSSVAQQAIHFAKWEDPFVSFDAEGLPKRQLTFSADRSFCGQEGCSCIDTILINHVTVLLSLNQKRLNLLKRSIALGESNVIGRKSS